MKPRGCFQYRFKGNCIEVWLGPPGNSESEFILSVHQDYIPNLIATLIAANGGKK